MGKAWSLLRDKNLNVFSPLRLSSLLYYQKTDESTDSDSSKLTESELMIINKIVNEFGYSQDRETFFVEWRKGLENDSGDPQKQCIIRSDEKNPKIVYVDNPKNNSTKLKVEKISTATLFNISDTHEPEISNVGEPPVRLSRKLSHPLKESLCFLESVEGDKMAISAKESLSSFKSFLNLVDVQTFSDTASLKSALKDLLDCSKNERRNKDLVDFLFKNDSAKIAENSSKSVDQEGWNEIPLKDLKRCHFVMKEMKNESVDSYLKPQESMTTSYMDKISEDGESATLPLSFTREVNSEPNANTGIQYIKLPPSMNPNMYIGGYLPSLTENVKECVYATWKKSENNHWTDVPAVKDLNSLTSPLVIVTGGLNLLDVRDYFLGSSIFCYNLNKDRWEFLDCMPEPRNYHSSVVLDSKIYIIGGYCPFLRYKGDMVSTPTTYCLDTKTMKWKRLPDMNCPRACHAIAALKNKIYIFGGRDKYGKILKTMEVYCPNKRSWSLQEKMPMPLMGCGVAHDENKVWLIGGVTSQSPGHFSILDTVFSYEPRTEKWVQLASLPEARAYCSATMCQGKLWVCGGASIGARLQSTSSVIIFNDRTGTWDQHTSLEPPRHAAAICTTSNKVVLIGGVCSLSRCPLTAVSIFDLKASPQPVAPFPSPIVGCAAVEILSHKTHK